MGELTGGVHRDPVIPAEAGIYNIDDDFMDSRFHGNDNLDSRLRGNDNACVSL